MGVYGRRCIRPGCRGTARFEYSDVDLYNQLRFFRSLFDSEKAKNAAIGSPKYSAFSPLCLASFFNVFADDFNGMVDNSICRGFLGGMAGVVDRYFEQSGRRWVDLGALFGGMQL